MAEATIMVLKVDLGCDRCYKKIKKLLCKFPEIRDQAFFEKEDTVIIKVVCCSPERIREKLICKGGKTIKSIEIKVPEPPKPPPKTSPGSTKEPDKRSKPKTVEEPPSKTVKETPPKTVKEPPPKTVKEPPPKTVQEPPPKTVEVQPPPVHGHPVFYPIGGCCNCKPCYEGHGGRCPCHHGYGIPSQPPSYDGYVRLVPSYDGWPSGCRCNRSYGCRCEFLTEENPTCITM